MKFVVIEYTDPMGDGDNIEVDLSWTLADATTLLSYQVTKHERQWVEYYGPTDYFTRMYPQMVAVVALAHKRFADNLPVDDLTILDWQE